MLFNPAETSNPIDRVKVVGRAVDRIDGAAKVTGTARYTNDITDLAKTCHGYMIPSPIAKGLIVSIDTARALQAPGVLDVITSQSAGPLGTGLVNNARLLGGPEIEHYHQAVALVVAETLEQARHAASLVDIDCQALPGRFDFAGSLGEATIPTRAPGTNRPQMATGDFDAAYAAAVFRTDEIYETSNETPAMMEPHASVASWDGEALTLWTSTQIVDWIQRDLGLILGIPQEKIRVISQFVGGGFGAKTSVHADALLAALGARAVGRPVKVVLPRSLIFNNTQHRSETKQRIRLGAGPDGRLCSISHEAWSGDLHSARAEACVLPTRLLYAAPNRRTDLWICDLDLPECGPFRAPGEAPGLMALEVAMDELAEKLGIDPVELRIINDTQVDPENPERPFSQRQLTECLRIGVERFGWQPSKPGSRRDGRMMIGTGMAVAVRNHLLVASGARVRLTSAGQLIVETDMTDIGTGSYTIIAQTAAEMLGLRLEDIDVRLGDSTFPTSSGSAGQFGASNSTAGVYAACVVLRDRITQAFGFNSRDAVFSDGMVSFGNRSIPLLDAVRDGEIVAEDTIEYGTIGSAARQTTFGAHFVEVGVDMATGETRVRRMLAICAAGRILNPKTARSQIVGAMTMGIGAALMEHLVVDKSAGFFVNHDLAGYEVPVHADIPDQDVVFIDEPDIMSSPMRAKGVGELGLCGVGAAISNAVYNATGIRVRKYPLTPEKLAPRLPELLKSSIAGGR